MRKATLSDKPIVIDILTRAFDTNTSVNYVVKQDRNRMDRIRGLMDYSFDVCFEFGEVWMSDNNHACALILFPDKKRTTVKSVLWDIKLAWSAIGLWRVGMIMKRESMIKKSHPKEPFAYLWFVGVDPDYQGRGMGSEFVRELVAGCDKIDQPIYLETSMERNLPFYKKFGFEIFHTSHTGYTLYHLRRFYIPVYQAQPVSSP